MIGEKINFSVLFSLLYNRIFTYSVPNFVLQQTNLKQKFVALLRRFKVSEDVSTCSCLLHACQLLRVSKSEVACATSSLE